jgi:hypothetical protein
MDFSTWPKTTANADIATIANALTVVARVLIDIMVLRCPALLLRIGKAQRAALGVTFGTGNAPRRRN